MPFTASDQTAQWDQNLKTLGSALFPDPSKAAHAYYYGSEARKAQLESNKLIDQGNWRADYGMKTQGGPQPALPTYYTPQNVPGAFPIRNPPANLPYAGSAAPQAAPAPAPMANLAAFVTSSTPAQGADMVAKAIPSFTTGRAAQLFGPPSSEAPPAPQTTGSDGSVPNDEGVLQKGSITDPNGGLKQSGPASHTGSPSPMPPGMTLPGLMALAGSGALAGFDAATIQAGGAALAYELYNRGQIGRDQYHQMLGGAGAPGLGVADIGAASASNVANINAASAARTTGMVVGGEMARQEAMPVQVYNDQGQPVYERRGASIGRRAVEPTVEATRQGQTGAYGQYLTPGGVKTMTAGEAGAAGVPAAVTNADQPGAQTIQRINAMPEGPEKQQAIQNWRALQATPKEITPEQQRIQQVGDYEQTQRVYAPPQKGLVKLGITEPAAFDLAADTAIDKRQAELQAAPGGRYLLENPAKARAAAINDLMKNPTADGLRLPTRAEVNKQREPIRTRIATAGTYGDERLDDFYNPLTAKQEAHMTIRLVPKDYTPGAPAKGAAATPTPSATAAPAATAASANFVDPSMPAMPAPTAAAPTAPTAAAPTAPVAAAPPPVPAAPYTPPGQGFGARIMSIFGGNTPPYVSPRPGQAPAAAPPAPAAAPTVSGGAPPGALGPAPAGSIEGAPVYGVGGRPVGFNRGGWVYPQ